MTIEPFTPTDLERDDPVGQVLVWCERGLVALQRAESIAQAQDVLAIISTVEHAVRIRNLNIDACIAASALRVRAERRVGELIAIEREAGRLASKGGDQRRFSVVSESEVASVDFAPPETLADHGISRDQAVEFGRLAAVPGERFEEALKNVVEFARRPGHLGGVTRAAVLRSINPEAEKSHAALWRDADRFGTECRKVAKLGGAAVTAVRFGAYPEDEFDSGDFDEALELAAAAIRAVQQERRRAR